MVNISRAKLITVAGAGWMFDAMDILILSYIIALLGKWYGWTQDEKTIIILANNLGLLTGAFLFGYLADRFGRKNIFITTLLIYSILTPLQGFVKTYVDLALLRYFIGLGLGGELPVVATLVSELSSPEKRGENVVLLESFWAYGTIMAASVAYFLIPWIGYSETMILLGLTAFFIFVIRTQIPEPPRSVGSRRVSLKELVNKEYRKLIGVWIAWFSIALGYYGVFLWLPQILISKNFTIIRSFEYTLYMALAQVPGYFSAAYLVERVGRRPVFISYMIGSAITAVLFAYSVDTRDILLWGSLLNFFNLGAWGVIYAYTPELFNDLYRATATGSAGSIARIGMIIGPTIPSITRSFEYSLTTFAVIWLIGGLATLLTPETRKIIKKSTIVISPGR
jgi:putative MFS transporter